MMRLSTALVILGIAASSLAHAQVKTDAAKADELIDTGMKHFNAHEYPDALADFEASYKLVRTPLAAVLIAQTQANVDARHATVVINWLATAVQDASGQTVESSTWAAFLRATNAAFKVASDLETSVKNLAASNAELNTQVQQLASDNKKLRDENKKLREQFSSFKAQFEWMQAKLSKEDRDRLKENCAFGACGFLE
jgi:predicted RNase H-like nuclease (RuvC/YqgF family)